MKSEIKWTSVEADLPDDEISVLIATNDGDVWIGYKLGDVWFWSEGLLVESGTVQFWADIPPHPNS